jgi:hypothetical protein
MEWVTDVEQTLEQTTPGHGDVYIKHILKTGDYCGILNNKGIKVYEVGVIGIRSVGVIAVVESTLEIIEVTPPGIFETVLHVAERIVYTLPNCNTIWSYATFETAIELHNYGFLNPTLTGVYPSINYPIGNSWEPYHEFVAMTRSNVPKVYNGSQIFQQKYTDAMTEHVKIMKELHEKNDTISYIDNDSVKHVFDNFVGLPREAKTPALGAIPTWENPSNPLILEEHYGSFLLTKKNYNGEDKVCAYLDYLSISRGGMSHVDPDYISNISFHTHQTHGLVTTGLPDSWPSSLDWNAATKYRNTANVLMIFTYDGLWVFGITEEYKMFLNNPENFYQVDATPLTQEATMIQTGTVNMIGMFRNQYIERVNAYKDDKIGLRPFHVKFIDKEEFYKREDYSYETLIKRLPVQEPALMAPRSPPVGMEMEPAQATLLVPT